jgi:hypothetical protein
LGLVWAWFVLARFGTNNNTFAMSVQDKLQISGYALLVFVVCMAVCTGTIYGVQKKSLFGKYWADILLWIGVLVLYFLLSFASMFVFTVNES